MCSAGDRGLFMWRFGMHIHVWRRIDSQFRLVTARRNPNMVILVAALAVRPARRRDRAGRAVVGAQPDLPCRPAGAGRGPGGARGKIISWLDRREHERALDRPAAGRARGPAAIR
jgi:hypothetical protein